MLQTDKCTFYSIPSNGNILQNRVQYYFRMLTWLQPSRRTFLSQPLRLPFDSHICSPEFLMPPRFPPTSVSHLWQLHIYSPFLESHHLEMPPKWSHTVSQSQGLAFPSENCLEVCRHCVYQGSILLCDEQYSMACLYHRLIIHPLKSIWDVSSFLLL